MCSAWQSFLQERPYATAYWPFSVRESCTSNANPPCVELWGPLAENEMFTFAPYPFISGSMTLDAIRKADLFINFDIVRQMKEPEILTTRDLLRKGWGI
ncbi:T6SS immunity protein Tdi1 domain-containing protein [Neisseria sp. 20925_1_37]|uniref:T6SS immunity protein Tdi1 domain-containing protein n=1 Tax=Neisseria sp. 20925_1_37 TaxID=3003683 RepID=UPI00352F8B45